MNNKIQAKKRAKRLTWSIERQATDKTEKRILPKAHHTHTKDNKARRTANRKKRYNAVKNKWARGKTNKWKGKSHLAKQSGLVICYITV